MSSNGVLSKIDLGKKISAVACVDDHVKSGHIIGVGSGSTAHFAIERLAERYKSGDLTNISCVPSSKESLNLLLKNKLPVTDLENHPSLDLYIDGADEVDQNLTCIKGGGGCLFEEKIVMSASKKFYIIADFRKKSARLGQHWHYIPIEVARSAHVLVARKIESVEGGVCKLRSGTGENGRFITDNGNYIIDWHFPTDGPMRHWHEVNLRLLTIPGLIETGLFINVAQKAYFGMEDGTVDIVSAPKFDHLI